MKFKGNKHGVSISIYNDASYERGGHWHWLGRIVNKFTYIDDIMVGINFTRPVLGYSCLYYDGCNHCIWIAWGFICWGGAPHIDDVDYRYEPFKSKGK